MYIRLELQELQQLRLEFDVLQAPFLHCSDHRSVDVDAAITPEGSSSASLYETAHVSFRGRISDEGGPKLWPTTVTRSVPSVPIVEGAREVIEGGV